MLELLREIGQRAAEALRGAVPPEKAAAIPAELPVQPPGRPEFGDYQIAACLQLAKPLGHKPRDLALRVQEALAGHPALERAEVAGAGYVNLHLRTDWIARQIEGWEGDPARGLAVLARRHAGQRVVVDFSSPNIAKPMHVGHIRSTIIGDALQRILRAVGCEVVGDNHLGDWGTQFGKLIVAYRRWLDKDAYARDAISELVRLYQKFVADERAQAEALGAAAPAPKDAPKDQEDEGEAEAGPAAATPLLQEARAELAKLQRGDADNLALWREFVAASMATFARVYARLGVRFDVQLGESFYNERLAGLVEELLQRGIAEPSQGAVVCPVEGEPVPLLVRKGDGSFLYGTTDLATIEYRQKTWQPRRVLYVVGAPQQLHFRQVFAVARRMGSTCELEHVAFGSVLFPGAQPGQWVLGRTRDGKVPLLEDLLDEAIASAAEVTRQRNPELSPAQVAEVARVVGIGAVKYNDLCRDRMGDIRFDMGKAVDPDGNTAPYLQYAYARMRSIARKVAEQFPEDAANPPPIQLAQPSERALGRRLLDYPAVLEQVVRSARPHTLAEYLYDLAVLVSRFYNEVPVLRAPSAAERGSRLRLLAVVAQTLRHGLDLLGIEVVEEM